MGRRVRRPAGPGRHTRARFEDWPARLDTAIAAARHQSGIWGRHDCALFAAGVVRAITGEDFAAEYRGRYTTRIGAARVLRRVAHGDVDAAATRALGAPLAAPLMAQRGDVVALDRSEGLGLGICLGARIAVVGAAGLEFRPITDAIMAWRV
jgi:hypothetical protein